MNKLILIFCLLSTIATSQQKALFNTIRYGEYTKPCNVTFEVYDTYLIMGGVDKFNLYKPMELWKTYNNSNWKSLSLCNLPTVYISDNNIRIYIYKKNNDIIAIKIYGATYSNKKEKK